MRNRGFTLVELLVTMAISAILISFATVSLLGLQHKTSLTTTVNKITTDIRSQQLRAMNGTPTGIYFTANSYTLIDGSNFPVNLDEGLEFSAISFAGQTILFNPGNGEITAAGTVILRDKVSGEGKTFNVNKLGNIYELL